MTNKEKLIEMINNLNENGIELMLKCFNGMNENEKYNINTTTERLTEIQRIEKQKKEQEKAIREAEREKVLRERARENRERMKDIKASLTGKEKKLIEAISKVNPGNYNMYSNELMIFADIHNNNLLNGSIDIFNYGFLKGQRAEKAIQKRLREKVRVC